MITKTKSTYIMIERLDDIEDIQGLLPLLWRFKGRVCSQDTRLGDGLGTRLAQVYIGCVNSVGNHNFTLK